ncbi:NAD(P)-dependent oxidoreductase (plasmid) [Methylobacterium oryzae CBMB20]
MLGLGGIGSRIARRCAGFDMAVRYHNRRPVPDAPWDYAPSLGDLCAWADVLFVALPGRCRDPPLRRPRGPRCPRSWRLPP